jgi:uncharacterized membrane protein
MTYLTLVSLHVLAAVIWIGGMLFLGLVLVPVLRNRPSAERAALLHAVGRRFLAVGWMALGTLLVTGPLLWALRGFPLGLVMVHKLILVAILLVLSVLHDFVLGPRLVALIAEGEASDETARLRRRGALLARLNVLLALVVLILGLAVSRGL